MVSKTAVMKIILYCLLLVLKVVSAKLLNEECESSTLTSQSCMYNARNIPYLHIQIHLSHSKKA